MGYKYVVIIRDQYNRIIESVGTNNKFYAKWICDIEAREHGHKCTICKLDDFEENNFIL